MKFQMRLQYIVERGSVEFSYFNIKVFLYFRIKLLAFIRALKLGGGGECCSVFFGREKCSFLEPCFCRRDRVLGRFTSLTDESLRRAGEWREIFGRILLDLPRSAAGSSACRRCGPACRGDFFFSANVLSGSSPSMALPAPAKCSFRLPFALYTFVY